MRRFLLAFLLSAAAVWPAAAQSTAINGSIEGVISDESGAVLPGVTVTVTNLDTGDTRVVVTNESGLYRAPLLPLGSTRSKRSSRASRSSNSPASTCRPARRP